jgi:hypothetical protein
MKFCRLTTSALVVLAASVCAGALRADTIEIQFAGTISGSNAPGISVGESFSGEFTYSTTDPFDVSIGGQSTYSLTSPEDSESVSVGSFNLLLQPLPGVHAFVSPGASSYFLTQDFFTHGTSGISVAFYGGSDFLSSQALPDPLNTADFTGGSIGFGFSEDNVDYSVQGNITQVSTAPEPRGVAECCLGIVALIGLLFRRSIIVSRS